jgi:Ni,Fe-hydrogenase III large subunit
VKAKSQFLSNPGAAPLDQLAVRDFADFRTVVLTAVQNGARIASLFGVPRRALGEADPGVRLFAVLAQDAMGLIEVLCADVASAFPSLTPDCLQAHLFEREIHEQTGLVPEGHPWLKPVRYPPVNGVPAPQPGTAAFLRLQGDEVHEVAVGPVHAGIIEPGHFRFQCHGENVYALEIALGYQHRGIETRLRGGPDLRSVPYMETLAGDTTIGHALAYAQLVETLAGVDAPPRGHVLRGLALELERLANHTGDLGALANDVGFLPTASFNGRIRGDFLNMTAQLCGSRFGRGLVHPGGAGFDADPDRIRDLLGRLARAERDVTESVDLLLNTPSVLARFEGVGTVSGETAAMLGLVGPAARASGLRRDVRQDFPSGLYRFAHLPAATWPTGDVFARACVRWLEIGQSIAFIREQAAAMPPGPCAIPAPAPGPNRLAVSLVEGWRGEIAHVALTRSDGRFAWYKVTDPSFHNWTGLAIALRNQAISDFPLCNKSFNLSYCGHDL